MMKRRPDVPSPGYPLELVGGPEVLVILCDLGVLMEGSPQSPMAPHIHLDHLGPEPPVCPCLTQEVVFQCAQGGGVRVH